MSQIERIFWIDARIREGAYPDASDVARQFEVSLRQAYQDRAYLADRLHAPIAYNRRHKGWSYADPAYFLPAFALRQGELLAFLLAQQLSERYLGTPFEEQFDSALRKIREFLPDTVSVDAEVLSGFVAFSGGPRVETDPQLLFALNRAAAGHRLVRLTYYSANSDQTTVREVDPYRLHNLRGDWYLIAYCHLRREFRDFLVSRIRSCETLEIQFVPSQDFDFEKYLRDGFLAERGREVRVVRIRFDSYQSRWARERRYHPTQTTEELPDGGLILTMETGGLEEVARWVLGFGPRAEVLEPEELRLRVAEMAKKTAEIYIEDGE